MKQIDKYTNKKILVLGLALSGVSAAKLLHKLKALVTVNDYKNLDENPEARELINEGLRVITGGHPIELMDEDFELIVKNPGIPYSNPIVKKAIEKGIPIITEVELAYEVNESKMIGITGTNGKTTTTTMITEILNTDRVLGTAYAAGNIGTPASEVAMKATESDVTVLELSSFQLLGTLNLKPAISVITNLYSAHLDYHGTREEYVKAKMKITDNQTENDYLIYNADQEELSELVIQHSKAQLIPFSRKKKVEQGIYVKNDRIYFNEEEVLEVNDILLPGKHNLENALAAIAVAKLMNKSNEAIKKALMQFKGVKHRTQFVCTFEGRKFYNDSKATNSLATINALEGFENPIILLAGGLDRGVSFDELIPAMKKNVKAVLAFGETAEKIIETAKKAGINKTIKVVNVEQAVPEAYKMSEPNDIILLSPACASWDQYPSFEIRGNAYMESIDQFIQSKQEEE
ncbi:UDP-N-acetylmuramoyl-L-alanine--D-glutamate ligase [Marinilactibacillus sp. 15R]|uniref:UDP-N-acetylmuramoyl-L-alanine--D-glutamate ligase n=1 Tax=Marinilactibacillus sp. 15R TaxID=1911586 RepID=UPI00090B2A57|nr:UDP-N-acetylmuramoyl-L-alanine--D-glutamate ligase [Marinilactibacillus sp. 15R]API89149.1 UDP-N-acetylmuramoyl-L-alanine--D-glutamate ligase [Marinilactibacillus sp. 15R]